MTALTNLLSISRFETKTLMRSWFFRIFSILVLTFLFFYNLFAIANPKSMDWFRTANAAMIPLTNLIMLNYVQTVIAVFLSSDFLRRDKKLDTSEVIFVRPVSNSQYVFGKTLGILWVFLVLNILVLGLAVVFNLISTAHPVVWEAYLIYPIIIGLPSLLFILGLSYLTMIVVKNQAISYVVILGLVGLSIFYLDDKLYGLTDFMNTRLPLLYSEIIGFSNLKEIVLQKSTYFLIGIGFMFCTIRVFGRLPNSKIRANFTLLVGVVFIAAGLFCGYTFIEQKSDYKEIRKLALEANNKYATYPTVTIYDHRIDLKHEDDHIVLIDTVSAYNNNPSPIDTLILSLNPGLVINEIKINNKTQAFKRDNQVLLVKLSKPIFNDEDVEIIVNAAGTILSDYAYLDISWEKISTKKHMEMTTFDRKYAFVSDDYLLLTPENVWYPIAGVTYNSTNHKPREINFSDYSLKVDHRKDLMAISQGKKEVTDVGSFFLSDNRLTGLSLVIGNYVEKSVEVSKIKYSLYHLKDHDFYSKYFTLITDTLPAIIDDMHQEYERELDLFYEFSRFGLVEVPAQFDVFKRSLTSATELVQPELVFYPEKGFGLNGVEFHRQNNSRNRNRNNTNKTPLELEVDKFKVFAYSTVLGGVTRNARRLTGGRNNYRVAGSFYGSTPFTLFPMYYNHVIGFDDANVPFLNTILESYFRDGFSVSMFDQFTGGMSDVERANLILQEATIGEILANQEYESLIQAVIRQKGSYLFSLIRGETEPDDFENFFLDYYDANLFKVNSLENLTTAIYDSLAFDLEPHLQHWVNSEEVPSYLVGEPELFETKDEFGAVYLVKFRATNYSNIPGILNVSMRVSGQRGSGNATTEDRIYNFEANESKEIQILMYDQPRLLSVNTIISGNIPATTSKIFRTAEKKEMVPEEYEITIDVPVSIKGINEIVIDNEDDNFKIVDNKAKSKLKMYIDSLNPKDKEDEYVKIYSGTAPYDWRAAAHTGFYGEFIRSAYITRKGIGDMKAIWAASIPESGMYEVYTYIPMMAMMSRGSDRNKNSSGGNSSQRGRGPQFGESKTIYNYTIKTTLDSLQVEFPLQNIEDGWNRIGAYHFEEGEAAVILSNETNGRRIIADAIKFVKVR